MSWIRISLHKECRYERHSRPPIQSDATRAEVMTSGQRRRCASATGWQQSAVPQQSAVARNMPNLPCVPAVARNMPNLPCVPNQLSSPYGSYYIYGPYTSAYSILFLMNKF